jgi:hypothetical protein
VNDRLNRIAAELVGLSSEELEEVLRMAGLNGQRHSPTQYLVSESEYSRHRAFFDDEGVSFKPGSTLGGLIFPPGTRACPSPTVSLPKGGMFVLAITGGTSGRRIIPL